MGNGNIDVPDCFSGIVRRITKIGGQAGWRGKVICCVEAGTSFSEGIRGSDFNDTLIGLL